MGAVVVILLLLQTATAGPLLDEPRHPLACPADPAPGGEVVVCGRTGAQERFRLHALPERYGGGPAGLPPAQTAILGGRAALAAEAEAGSVGGVQSNRMMVRLKFPFGK